MAKTPGVKPMKGMARVSFLAQAGTIRGELEQGWPLKAIHQRHADKLGMSYAQFCRYVSAYMADAGWRTGRQDIGKEPDRRVESPKPVPKPASAAPLIRQFQYNPRAFDDDELI
jgi:hypothetical protein